jgi:hypothetical protein
MDNYQPNSHRSKEPPKVEPVTKKVEKVITGTAKTKKKGDFQKIVSVFLPDDVPSIKSYVWFDIVVPLIKKALSDTVDAFLYPGEGSRSNKNTTASRISYRNYYDDKKNDRTGYTASSVRTGYNYDDVILNSRGEAEDVLTRMEELISVYKLVSVADLYDLVDIRSDNYTNNKYGWTNLRSAQVVPTRGGYLLKLPRALPLD